MAAGIHRDTHYKWLKDPEYKARFENTREMFCDRLRHEAIRRNIEGVKTPIMYRGSQVRDDLQQPMWITVYSDRLLLALLKANCEEFKDKVKVTGEGGGPLQIQVVRYRIPNRRPGRVDEAMPHDSPSGDDHRL